MTRREAIYLRGVVEQGAQALSDAVGLTAVRLYPRWQEGTVYEAGLKVQHGGRLWRCLQDHTAQTGWEPEHVPALWEQISQTHAGTPEDPIPYRGGMALEEGRYYLQQGVCYHCTRDTGSPVYHSLAELVGLYVEAV